MEKHGPKQSPGVIFDLDGTLADTLQDLTDSINIAFERFGVAVVTPDRLRPLIGRGLPSLLRRASGIEDPDRIDALVEGYREVYQRRMLDRTRLYPGVAELLDRLVELGIPLAVLSNKPDEFTVPICAGLLARWPFVRWRGAREGSRRKPDPTTALQIAGEMNRPAPVVFFVGDSPADVWTARNAGMIAVAVTWGYPDPDELQAAGPAHVIDKPEALLQVLSGMAAGQPNRHVES